MTYSLLEEQINKQYGLPKRLSVGYLWFSSYISGKYHFKVRLKPLTSDEIKTVTTVDYKIIVDEETGDAYLNILKDSLMPVAGFDFLIERPANVDWLDYFAHLIRNNDVSRAFISNRNLRTLYPDISSKRYRDIDRTKVLETFTSDNVEKIQVKRHSININKKTSLQFELVRAEEDRMSEQLLGLVLEHVSSLKGRWLLLSSHEPYTSNFCFVEDVNWQSSNFFNDKVTAYTFELSFNQPERP